MSLLMLYAGAGAPKTVEVYDVFIEVEEVRRGGALEYRAKISKDLIGGEEARIVDVDYVSRYIGILSRTAAGG